ncbi:transposase, IS110 family [Klebsiella oxytoca]|nr:transposase, IS110 family [Klebsiella oxytoca]
MPWITVSMLSFVKPLRRDRMAAFFTQLSPCLIGIEAWWLCPLLGPGADPYGALPYALSRPGWLSLILKGQKNDANDAEAICEAVSRPGMRFVAIRTERQQTLQAEHRVRARLIRAGQPEQ